MRPAYAQSNKGGCTTHSHASRGVNKTASIIQKGNGTDHIKSSMAAYSGWPFSKAAVKNARNMAIFRGRGMVVGYWTLGFARYLYATNKITDVTTSISAGIAALLMSRRTNATPTDTAYIICITKIGASNSDKRRLLMLATHKNTQSEHFGNRCILHALRCLSPTRNRNAVTNKKLARESQVTIGKYKKALIKKTTTDCNARYRYQFM